MNEDSRETKLTNQKYLKINVVDISTNSSLRHEKPDNCHKTRMCVDCKEYVGQRSPQPLTALSPEY